MTNKSRYVFGAALAGFALGGIPGLVHHAEAALTTNADFTFESLSTGSTTGTAGVPFGGYAAESGTGTAYGVHAGTAQYSAPTGNGSAKSFSSNLWAVGDYYQFSVPTTGLTSVQIAFDQAGSSTGPAQFSLFYSVDGTTFSSLPVYSIASSSVQSFSSGTSSTAFYHSFDLSGVSAISNDASAVFRIVDQGTAAIGGASSGVGAGGTDRIDNFTVSQTPVPEPASLSLLTVAAAGLITRRRNQK